MDKTILLMEDSSDYNTPVDVLNKRDDSAHRVSSGPFIKRDPNRNVGVCVCPGTAITARVESCSLLDIINNPFASSKHRGYARRFASIRRGQPLDSIRTRNSRNSNLVSLFRIHPRISNYRVARTVKLIPQDPFSIRYKGAEYGPLFTLPPLCRVSNLRTTRLLLVPAPSSGYKPILFSFFSFPLELSRWKNKKEKTRRFRHKNLHRFEEIRRRESV